MKIPKIGQTLKTPRAVIDKVAYMSRASLKKVFEGYRLPYFDIIYMGYAFEVLYVKQNPISPSPTPSV